MKKLITLIILLFIYNLSFTQTFNTGSVEFDADLGVINANAKLDLKTFKVDLNLSHHISIPKIDELLKIMEPVEIILAKDIADIVQKPLEDVVSSYKVNKDKGWGYIAKELGIKPGSPEFHALKGKSKKSKTKGVSSSKGKGNSESKGNRKKK